MNIFKYEFKSSFKSMVYWFCVTVSIILVFLLMFPAFSEDAETVTALFEGFPPEILKSFGFDLTEFFRIEGYISFLFMYVLICVGLQAINLSLGIFSKEKRFKAFDFILTKPRARGYIFFWKAICVLAYILLNTILYVVVLLVMINLVDSGGCDKAYIILLGVSIVLIQLILASIGAFLAVVLPKIKSVSSISTIVVLGLYVVQIIENFLDSDKLKYLNPFAMYDSMEILKNGYISGTSYVVGIAMIVFIIGISVVLYVKKDIQVS